MKVSKLDLFFMTLAIVIIFSTVLEIALAYGQTSDIREDQYVLCNFEAKCFTFNSDDFLASAQIDEFDLFFNNDMDTYPIEELHD